MNPQGKYSIAVVFLWLNANVVFHSALQCAYMIYVYHISCHELFSMNFLGCYYLKGTISKDDLLQPLCSCGSLGRVRAG